MKEKTINTPERIKWLLEQSKKMNSRGDTFHNLMDPEFLSYNEEKQICKMRYMRHYWQDNGRGELHGGVISSMLDNTMGIHAIGLTEKSVSTAEMSVNYLKPGKGDSFIVESEVLQLGSRTIRITAKAFDESNGKCIAFATGIFMYIDYHKPVESRLGEMTETEDGERP